MLGIIYRQIRREFLLYALLLSYGSLYAQQKSKAKESCKIYQVILDKTYSESVEQGVPKKAFYISRVMLDGLLKDYDYKQVTEDTKERLFQNKLYQDSVWKRFLIKIDTSDIPPAGSFDISCLSSKRKFRTVYFSTSKVINHENTMFLFSPVIFSKDSTKAICTVEFNAFSTDSGSGSMFFFEKKKGRWKLVYKLTLYLV